MSFVETEVPSPIGPLYLAERDGDGGNGRVVVALSFSREPARTRLCERLGEAPEPGVPEARAALLAYLDGDLGALAALAVDPGGTPFQAAVWAALRAIPVGATASYLDIARAIGAPRAVRAVGAANGQNPIALIIPCHRVIRSDGDLCGFGGGLERKRWLLAHEGRLTRDLELWGSAPIDRGARGV